VRPVLIERDVLTPERIERALKEAHARAKAQLKKDPAIKRKLQAEIKRLEHEKENLVLLSAQKLDDPAGVAKAINERAQRIKACEMELASLPDEFDADKLASLKAKMAGDIARFRDMMRDRRNAPLARQVLRKLLIEPIRCIPIMRDGKRDFAIRGRATTGAFTSAPSLKLAANSGRPHGKPPLNPPSNSFGGCTLGASAAAGYPAFRIRAVERRATKRYC
jgi:hypothetical protein